MRTRNLLFVFAAIVFALVSCTSENAKNATESTSEDVALETRGVQSFGSKFQSEDNTYIVLKLDGTFEASFESDEVVKGLWSKENDGKTLKLTGEKSNEGKGQTFAKEFTVIEHTDDVISLVDEEGKKIEMKSE